MVALPEITVADNAKKRNFRYHNVECVVCIHVYPYLQTSFPLDPEFVNLLVFSIK